jgi:Putative zinc-finger
MKQLACQSIAIGAFVDNELSGAERVRVAHHLTTCSPCAAEAEELRRLGSSLRDAAAEVPSTHELAGLADGVVSRIRAENQQSWGVFFNHVFDGWRWVLAGSGALAAGLSSVAFVLVLLQFGPAPERRDSLMALIQALESAPPPPTAFATTVGDEDNQALMLVDPGADLRSMQLALVSALSDTLTREGKSIDVQTMSTAQRALAEALSARLDRMRTSDIGGSTSSLRFNTIRLLTTTNVSARGLD